jgi:hypothetical protein
MLGLLGVVRPRWPHLVLGRSRRAGLDILGQIFVDNLLTQHGPSHTSIGLRDCRDHELWRPRQNAGKTAPLSTGGQRRAATSPEAFIDYIRHDAELVTRYLEESFSFRVTEPDTAVVLTG